MTNRLCKDCAKKVSIGATRCQSCANSLTNTTHGLSKTRPYIIWKGMIGRCYDPKNASFKNYGLRGISVCEDWRAFENFLVWLKSSGYKESLTLDRKDSLGNYTATNCRWADRYTQGANKRVSSKNTSGFVGVGATRGRFYARISYKGKRVRLGCFSSKEEAALAYNNYILTNKFPHRLNEVLAGA